jgi:hypothetical protein
MPTAELATIRAYLKSACLTEPQLVSWLINDICCGPEDTTSLEELNPKWLKLIVDDWDEVLKVFLEHTVRPSLN